MKKTSEDFELQDPSKLFGERASERPSRSRSRPEIMPLPKCEPLVVKGNYAAAIGALLAGCRHVFGYPITPSTEGAELMAKLLPRLGGVFLQAVSEVATVNMMYGCGGAGLRCMTFTSSPGFSLMLEGISYMIGSEVPGVFVNVMRGGPGLGNIAPEQTDIKLACRGLGHGNTHAIVLRALDAAGDARPDDARVRAHLQVPQPGRHPRRRLPRPDDGQASCCRETMVKPGIPEWAVCGDAAHRGNLISSIYLDEKDLETHNAHLNEKYARMHANEQRADLFLCDDADVLVVACNTPARMAKGAVRGAAEAGRQGRSLPARQTLWPFPIDALLPLLPHARRIVVVEARPASSRTSCGSRSRTRACRLRRSNPSATSAASCRRPPRS